MTTEYAHSGGLTEAEDRRLGRLRIHVAPAAQATTAGVLLYPTIFGLNGSMRDFAAQLATAGFTAVVWDPYDGEDGSPDPGEMVARSKHCEDATVVADLVTVVDHMVGELGLERIGGLGWCFGGRLGLLHAGTDRRVQALATYNPTMWSPQPVEVEGRPMGRADFPEQTMDEFVVARAIRGPVQVCRPQDDFTRPAEYARLLDALFDRTGPTILEYFPGAEHAFSYKPGEANAAAHRFAWANTLALFAGGLGESWWPSIASGSRRARCVASSTPAEPLPRSRACRSPSLRSATGAGGPRSRPSPGTAPGPPTASPPTRSRDSTAITWPAATTAPSAAATAR
jgi:carboxymethylenebutenolidase